MIVVLCAEFDVEHTVRRGTGRGCKDATIGASRVSTVGGTLVCPVGSKHIRTLGTWPACNVRVVVCTAERQVAVRTYFSCGESLVIERHRERQRERAAAVGAMVAYVSVAGHESRTAQCQRVGRYTTVRCDRQWRVLRRSRLNRADS